MGKDGPEFRIYSNVPVGYPNRLSIRLLEGSGEVCPGAIDLRITGI